ncbi:MAG TPA: hypothetical protein VHV31_10875 [Nitrolancea sp.]|nr:hypothetical protein [Nitrolancea sp.]
MAEDETREGGFTIVAVPPDQVQPIIDFLATLESDAADVSGHMISNAAIGGGVGAAGRTLTYCGVTGGGITDQDWNCSDTDKNTYRI